jgi:type I restriction enzyme R subunit
MRPVNSMIEFKQIIGRGTRLFEGKHYFTIIDFVNAYHLFNDAEWDGEPICEKCGSNPCICEKTKRKPCNLCQQTPGICEKGRDDGGDEPGDKKQKLRIKLSDGKVREIQSMRSTMFYVDGKPISAEEFIQRLFNTLKLPEVFGTEDALRKEWANPVTRSELLKKLELHGCAKSDLVKLQEMIDAENCDLFDVLEYISYSRKPITRIERVANAESNIYTFLNEKQRDFIGFVLRNYVQDGVDELDIGKLSTMLTSKYGGVHAAQQALGNVEDIQKVFVDFQQYLYKENVA